MIGICIIFCFSWREKTSLPNVKPGSEAVRRRLPLVRKRCPLARKRRPSNLDELNMHKKWNSKIFQIWLNLPPICWQLPTKCSIFLNHICQKVRPVLKFLWKKLSDGILKPRKITLASKLIGKGRFFLYSI